MRVARQHATRWSEPRSRRTDYILALDEPTIPCTHSMRGAISGHSATVPGRASGSEDGDTALGKSPPVETPCIRLLHHQIFRACRPPDGAKRRFVISMLV